MKKSAVLFLLFSFLLTSCGAKKNVATGDQEPAASTLEQRIAAGEFAWLDTIHIDTTSSAWVKKYSGNYILSHQNMLHGQKMYGDSILVDSLILTPNGYYYKYNKDSLVDFGRISVRKVTHFKVCVEQYKVDLVKGEQTDEIERIETEIYNQGEFLTDWYSFTRDFHCFWTVRRYNTNSHRWELEIVMDVQNECIRYLWPGNTAIKWEKKNVATQSEKIALQDQGVLVATDAEIEKPTLGLLWQNDQLQITLNQGRQLDFYRAETDTLYLFETARDTADHSPRKYTLNIPTRELLIIKYNDSLVYPLMPITEPCEYPLDIKSMGAKKLEEFLQKQEEARARSKSLPTLSPNLDIYPLELRADTYFYNANSYKYGMECECVVDSTKKLIFNVDGSWLQYENEILKNCGIMRKNKSQAYLMENCNRRTVFFLDTIGLAGHIVSLREDKRRWQEHISYATHEYYCVGKYSPMILNLFPCRADSTMNFFFDSEKTFMLEGSTCGWERIDTK